MIQLAGYEPKCDELTTYVNVRLIQAYTEAFREMGLDFANIDYERDMPILARMEKKYREMSDGCPLLVPLSVPKEGLYIQKWLTQTLQELKGLLLDTTTASVPSLKGEYLMVRLLEYYIEIMNEKIFLGEADASVFSADLPEELEKMAFDVGEEVFSECYAGGEEGTDKKRRQIQKEARLAFADLRCWIGYPEAPSDLESLLLWDTDYPFLDQESEGMLRIVDEQSHLGIF